MVERVATRVVAFGGGHGLFATLRALAESKRNSLHNDLEIIAIVGVSDDGGSSGILRQELPIIPPGDLRMALAALSPYREHDPTVGSINTWEDLMQFRFPETMGSSLNGHVVGNILLAALWQSGYSAVAGLDTLGKLLGTEGVVLPCSDEPIQINAEISRTSQSGGEIVEIISGQVAVATTNGNVLRVALEPREPQECPEAIEAVQTSNYLIFGPGSWFTSVVPHLLIPSLHAAIKNSSARKVLVINLEPQLGETTGFEPRDYVKSWVELFPEIQLDIVIIDPKSVEDCSGFESFVSNYGIDTLWMEVAKTSETHDPRLLSLAFDTVMTMKRGTTWQ